MQTPKCLTRHILCLVIGLYSLSHSYAQKVETNLYDLVPSDSLMFMAYTKSSELKAESLTKLFGQKYSESLDALLHTADEICFYGQKIEAFDCYTILLKGIKNFSLNKTDSLLQSIDLSVSELTPGYAILDGGQHRKGILHFTPDYYELKLFSQMAPVDKKMRIEFEELLKQLDSDRFDQTVVVNKLDSIGRLDSLNAANYFKRLLTNEQLKGSQSPKHAVKYSSIFKNHNDKPAGLFYVNADGINGLPFHLQNIFRDSFYDNYYDTFKLTEFSSGIISYYEDSWIKLTTDSTTIQLTSVLSNKSNQKHIHKKLDKDLIKYLPANASSFYSYNFNLSDLKYHLARYLRHEELRGEEKAYTKLAILAIDDDWLNAVGNGFIAITDSSISKRDVPDFKMALKMPNPQKGKILLDILRYDMKLLYEVDKNCYILSHPKMDIEQPLHLLIKDDIWLLGTAPFEILESELSLSQVKQLYPKAFSKKISQYLTIDEQLLKLLEINCTHFELKSQLISKKSVSTHVIIKTN